jgi:hypothetical protein
MKGIIRKGSKAEEKLRAITEDIGKKIETGKLNGLTLSDIFSACDVGKELVAKGVAQTFISSVADYFKSFGFIVTMDFNNVNYVIVA